MEVNETQPSVQKEFSLHNPSVPVQLGYSFTFSKVLNIIGYGGDARVVNFITAMQARLD
jgi:hypothetical protein